MKKVKICSLILFLTAMMFVASTTAQAQQAERTMSLKELFQLADSASLALKSAKSQAQVANAAVEVAKNKLLPDVNVTASATYNGNA